VTWKSVDSSWYKIHLFLFCTSCTLRALLRLQFNLNETRYFVLIVFIEELLNMQYFFIFLSGVYTNKSEGFTMREQVRYSCPCEKHGFPKFSPHTYNDVLVLCWWSLQKWVAQDIANVWARTTYLSESLECVATVNLFIWIFHLKLELWWYCSSSFSLVTWSLVTWSLSHLVISLLECTQQLCKISLQSPQGTADHLVTGHLVT
jgi:hypothetical protein